METDSQEIEADYAEAVLRNQVLDGRTKQFNHIIEFFTNDEIKAEQIDVKFVVESVAEKPIRDAVLHWLSDKYQVDTFKDEITLDDCSVRRHEFLMYLLYCGVKVDDEFGDTVDTLPLKELMCAILLLDQADPEFVQKSIEVMVMGNVENLPSLSNLMLIALKRLGKDAGKVFKASIEENDIVTCLTGAQGII